MRLAPSGAKTPSAKTEVCEAVLAAPVNLVEASQEEVEAGGQLVRVWAPGSLCCRFGGQAEVFQDLAGGHLLGDGGEQPFEMADGDAESREPELASCPE